MRRLNAEGRGRLLGEFKGDDKLIVWTSKNQYYITGYDLAQHFPDDTVRVDRFEADRVYSLCYYDREQHYYYLKRFTAEMSDRLQFFLEEGQADFVCLTDKAGAKLEITYKGAHAARPADLVDVDEFVGVKSHRAKGKRLTTYEVATLRFIEPELPPEPEPSDGEEPLEEDDAAGVEGAAGISAAAGAAGGSSAAGAAGAAGAERGGSSEAAAEDAPAAASAAGNASRDAAAGAAPKGASSAQTGAQTGASTGAQTGKRRAAEPRGGEISTTGLPKTGGGGVDFEIERAKGDVDEVIDPEQLNLF